MGSAENRTRLLMKGKTTKPHDSSSVRYFPKKNVGTPS